MNKKNMIRELISFCFKDDEYNVSYRKIIRVPVGFDQVSVMANLFLYYYGNK